MQRLVGTSRGLTIIEMMAAMAISTMLLGGAWQLLQEGMQSYQRGLENVRMTQSARTIMRLVTQDIQRAMAARVPYGIRSAESPASAVPPESRQAERLSLTVVAASPAQTGSPAGGEAAQVAYVLQTGPEHRAPALQRLASGIHPQRAARMMAAYEHVQSFDIRYLDGQQWHNAWQRPEPPQAVELTLVLQSRGAQVRTARFTALVTAE
ncbi:MAG: prepilin-type N-terminal cleavage/methylation domain-containing protein [Candidatus Tectomicrobia bacterium]|uniref:Type II secretion system protein J n=1 Tax=Tectimicrobiota bacterium TaxID=2528274 RepID=A0A937W4J8_UNCTE|nr:prepilin-type N-terminal cleavage/methylation domain-containing protein [Candidatus Tectomicrobia bacterium]